MLGEKIGEETGVVTTQRILPSDGLPRLEISFEASGVYFGVQAVDRGTYTAEMRADGTIYGQGQGVVMGMGGEVATWTGSGVGVFGVNGSIRYSGAIFYRTSVPAWERLNRCAGVFEYDVDAANKTVGRIWEWNQSQ